MGNPSYFGISLGQALATGAEHINKALERRYQQEMDRERQLKMEQLTLGQAGVAIPQETLSGNRTIGYAPEMIRPLIEANQRKISMEEESGKSRNELMRAQAKLYSEKADMVTAPTTPGQKVVDTAFAKKYAEYLDMGGFGQVVSQIQNIEKVRDALKSGQVTTGPIAGRMFDFMRPASVAAQQEAENVIQRSLRQTLGAQFTETEGKMFMKRGFDPTLKPEINAAKMDRIINELKTAAAAKEDAVAYFEKNGTMKGYKGKLYGLDAQGNMVEINAGEFMQPSGKGQMMEERIRVRRKDGKTGTINAADFDPAKYERI